MFGTIMRNPILLAPVFALFAAVSAIAAPCTPFVGAICAGGEAITYDQMIERLRAADIAILGERHDNPAHHAMQAQIVGDLAPKGLAFEMVPFDKEDYANAARLNGDDLAEALEWEASGWPDFAMYAPIFDAAPEAWIAGGGVAVETLKAAIREGAAKAWPEGAARYGLSDRLPQDVIDAMLEEQAVAHCGALPTAMLPGMVEAQQLRDAAFADAALRLSEAGHGPAVLITGNGHARTDRGSPLYLSRAAPDLAVVSLGQEEWSPGDPPRETPFDIVIFTEPFDRGDPCEDFVRRRQKP